MTMTAGQRFKKLAHLITHHNPHQPIARSRVPGAPT